MPESLEHAKGRALALNDAGKPIEAICVILHALRGLGVDPLDIADELALLQAFNDGEVAFTDGVRQWVSDLKS
jgi:hypothetical protein